MTCVKKKKILELISKNNFTPLVFVNGNFSSVFSKISNYKKNGIIICNDYKKGILQIEDSINKDYSDKVNYCPLSENCKKKFFPNCSGIFCYEKKLGLNKFRIELNDEYKNNFPIHLINITTSNCKKMNREIELTINLKSNSKAKIFEHHIFEKKVDDKKDIETLITTNIELEKSSSLEYYFLSEGKGSSINNQKINLIQNEKSKIFSIFTLLSEKGSIVELKSIINGKQSNTDLNAVCYSNKVQKIKFLYNCINNFNNINSNFFIKNLADGSSEIDFTGKIFVEKNIKKCISRIICKNVLLSKSSKINSSPILDILSEDVNCSHSTSYGTIEEDIIQYFQTRGISRILAKKIMKKSFFNEILYKNIDKNIFNYINKLLTKLFGV